jgi:hypothetical protein
MRAPGVRSLLQYQQAAGGGEETVGVEDGAGDGARCADGQTPGVHEERARRDVV